MRRCLFILMIFLYAPTVWATWADEWVQFKDSTDTGTATAAYPMTITIWVSKVTSRTLGLGDEVTSPVYLYDILLASTAATTWVKHSDYRTSDPVTHADYRTSDPVTHADYRTSDPVTHADYLTSDPLTHSDALTSKTAGWFSKILFGVDVSEVDNPTTGTPFLDTDDGTSGVLKIYLAAPNGGAAKWLVINPDSWE